jgi:NADH-quinone oxidoreductase subunit L
VSLLETSWVIPLFPLVGFLVLAAFGTRFIREPGAGALATLMMAGAFGWTVVLFVKMWSLDPEQRTVSKHLFDWVPTGGLNISASLLLDPLSITMLLFITGVGMLIHLYAIAYMHGDPRFSRFFLYLNMFAFSMIMLVLGGNFLLTFLGWEGVGLCSYLLISFWFERPSAATAGKKAFITNRVGDFGFMIAMFLIVAHLGSLEYSGAGNALEGAHGLSNGTATAIALMLFLACCGKSAQFPLHVWLPDAMEGPTPVSALIHAATMVTSGIYLVARAHPFFEASQDAGTVVAWVGVVTALMAATIALVKNDIKRVLAYSTVSQLGYMFLALGLGAYSAAIFHVVTHAFFKALLFLGAGSVIHGMHDEQDMRRMGGLRKLLPITSLTFMVAWLSIAGIVPLSGFWSKDEILAKAWADPGSSGKALWAIGAVTALLTAFYMTRQVYMVFFSPPRWQAEAHPVISGAAVDTDEDAHAAHDEAGAHGHGATPHESPPLMTFPLIVLGALTIVGGLLNLPYHAFENLTKWLEPVFEGVPEVHIATNTEIVLSVVAVVIGAVGILIGARLYARYAGGEDPAIARLGPMARVLDSGYGVDAAYEAMFVKAGLPAAEKLAELDATVVDGAVNGVGELFRSGIGWIGSRAQSGFVRRYAVGIATGAVGLVLYAVVRG